MKCPKCNNQMKIRSGVHGAFWGCTGYPECRETVSIKKEVKHRAERYVNEDHKDLKMFRRVDREVSNFESLKDAETYMNSIKTRGGKFKINHYEKPDEFWQVEWKSEG